MLRYPIDLRFSNLRGLEFERQNWLPLFNDGDEDCGIDGIDDE